MSQQSRVGKKARHVRRQGATSRFDFYTTPRTYSPSLLMHARHLVSREPDILNSQTTLFDSERQPGTRRQRRGSSTDLPHIVFDVNETVLNLQTMEPVFARIFGEKDVMRLWFSNLILYSAALTIVNCYVSFTD